MTESFYQQEQQIKKHYEKIADNYDIFWDNSANIVDFYSNQIVKYLDLKSTEIFVDIGYGTGIYTKKIRDIAQLINPALCVDVSAKMLEKIPESSQFQPILMDAVEFSQQPGQYDKVLMQGMLHHIKDIDELIENLFCRLNFHGKILTIGIPRDIEYPLFNAALKRFKELHPVGNQIRDIFMNAGFKFTRELIKYSVSIEKERYFSLIRNRYIAILNHL